MANHKSTKKRIRQTVKLKARNNSLQSSLRTAIKKYRALFTEGKAEDIQAAYPIVQKKIDKAVTKGIIKHETASRYKSRLKLALNKLQSKPTADTTAAPA